MIDGFKLNLSYLDEDKLRSLPFLTFSADSSAGGKPCLSADWKGLKFRIFIYERHTNRIELYGSLHKFYNTYFDLGEQNHDDFDYEKIHIAIDILKTTIGIIPSETIVENLEYGVNVLMSIDGRKLLKHTIAWKCKEHIRKEVRENKGLFYQYATEFKSVKSIKFYTKGIQYDQSPKLIRFEVRCIRSRAIYRELGNVPTRKRNKVYLDEITTVRILRKLRISLIRNAELLTIVDTLRVNRNWSKPDQKRFNNCTNPKRLNNMNDADRHYHTKKFREQKERLKLKTYKSELVKRISKKSLYLINYLEKCTGVIDSDGKLKLHRNTTNIRNVNLRIITPISNPKYTQPCKAHLDSKSTLFNHSINDIVEHHNKITSSMAY